MPHKTCKKKGLPAQTILICAIVGGLTASLLSTVPLVDAAPVYDYDNGSWTDLYSDNTGTSARSQANVDTSDGKLKLTNSGGGFIAPFYTTGYVRTTSIGAEAGVKIARWGTVTLTRELPPDTSITVQVLDEGNQIYPNSLLAGNETGFTDSVIDISDLALERTAVPGSAKVPRIRLLITLATINTDVTPEVDSVVVSWTTEQGDLSATTLADTAWPTFTGNNQNTFASAYSSNPVYQVLRWAKTYENQFGGGVIRGTGELLYFKTMGGTSNGSDRTNGVFEAVNRNSGETVWSETFSGQAATDSFITLGNNGSLYISGIENDILAAYDIDEKISTKWIYQFNGGHSNVQVAIADDGTLYTTRNDTSTNARIIAFNPDGSIKWTTAINPSGTGGTLTESHVGLASDGTVYVDSYRSTGQSTGTLYALDPEDGSITWTYPEIPSRNLLVDEEDTVYLADSYLNPSAPSTPVARRVVAVNSDGSLKWERTFDPTVMSYERIALSPEGVLVGYRAGYFSTTAYLDFFDIEDGSTVRTISIPDQGAYAGSGYLLVDSQGGIFATAVLPGQFSDLHYFDAEGNERWKLHRTFSGGALEPMIRPALDEDGRLYLSMLNYYTTYDSRILAFYPWTLTVSTDKEAVKAGETITFTAVTAMPQASPLTGDVNKMQLYLEGGQTVFFMYSGVNEDGDTEWTADFTVPEEMEYGEHSYTVEAGAAGIQTDIELHFTSPASGTNNTGYTVSDTFMVGSDAPVIVLNPLTSEPLDTALPVVSGTAIALNGTVSSVEFQVDSMTGAWQICDADDGDFDEVTEEFTCAVTSSLSNGSHTIFVRAGDSNGHVTQSGEEESATFSVAAEESGDEEVEVQEAGLSVSGEGIAWVAGGSLVVAGSYMAKRRGLFSNLVKKYKNTN